MAELGIVLMSNLPIQLSMELAQEAERRGFHSVWVTEGMSGKDAITQLTAYAMKTQRIRLGSGIVPIYFRTPVTAGETLVGLAELSGGRAILGLGASHPFIVEAGHGVNLQRPLVRMREYVEIIRLVTQEREFSYQGQVFNIPRYASSSRSYFEANPVSAPVFLAALRLRMARLAGEVADGVLMNLVPAEYLRRAADEVRGAARAAGRDPQQVTVASLVGASVYHDEAAAADAVRRQVASYTTLMPFYNRMHRAAGFTQEMDAIGPEVARRDVEGAARKIPDSMVRSLAVYGSAQQARDGLKPFEETGADLLVLIPYIPSGADTGQVIGDLIQAFARPA